MNKKDFIESLNRLKDRSKGTLSDHNFSEILIYLHKIRFNKIQSYKLELLATIYEQIRNTKGTDELETCRKIVLLECLLNSWNDIFSEKYPTSIQDQFKKNSERMLNMCENSEGWGVYGDDVYWKDLAIARQQMFPAGGGRIVEAYSGFGFRQGFSINFSQSFSFFKLLFYSGGRKGYYQSHLHIPLLSDFNEQGFYDCNIGIAEMLIKHEEIKGVFGSTWYYDPQLENISPRLMYVQKIPLENGAKLFYIGEDRTGNAFAKSKTRLKLYNEGKYKPKKYLLLWLRKEIIKWAKMCRSENM